MASKAKVTVAESDHGQENDRTATDEPDASDQHQDIVKDHVNVNANAIVIVNVIATVATTERAAAAIEMAEKDHAAENVLDHQMQAVEVAPTIIEKKGLSTEHSFL